MFNVDLNLFIYLFSDHRVHTAFIHWTLAFTLSFAPKGLSPRDTLCHGIRVLSCLLDVEVVVIMKRRWRKGKGRIFRKGCDFADSGEILSFDWLCWVFNFNRFARKKMCLVKTWDHPCGFYFRIFVPKVKIFVKFLLKTTQCWWMGGRLHNFAL